MLNTTAAFKTSVDSDQRRVETYVAIHFGGKAYVPTATATSQFDSTTPPSSAAIGRIRTNDFTCSGYANAAYAGKHKGWWSGVNSNSSGVFTTPQELVISYGEVIASKNLWFVADPYYYPVDFDVMTSPTSTGTWTLETSVTGNTKHVWSFIGPSNKSFYRVKIVVKKVATPSSNVRILHFGAVTTVLFEKDDIVDYNLLEETKAESTNPIGVVTANEFSMSINNELRWFTIDNVNSPFYGLVKPNLIVEPFVGFETITDNIEFVPLGKFRLHEWAAPSGSVESTLIAYDKLYNILDREIPMRLPIRNGSTLKDLFIHLFDAIGVASNEYTIEDSISFNIPFGWLMEGKASTTLQALVEAGNCSVFVDRLDIIRIKNNKQSGASIASLDDNNQIVAIENSQKFLNIYSVFKVDYRNYFLAEPEQVAFLENQLLVPGDTTFSNIKLSSGPVGNVMYVKIPLSTNVTTKRINMGAWSMDLTVNNSYSTMNQVADIEVIGRRLGSNTVQVEARDTNAVSTWGERIFTLDTPFIQDKAVAQSYANSMIKFVSDPKAFYSIDVRGNPSLELLDLITVKSDSDSISQIQLTITKNQLVYNGGLEGVIHARKVIS